MPATVREPREKKITMFLLVERYKPENRSWFSSTYRKTGTQPHTDFMGRSLLPRFLGLGAPGTQKPAGKKTQLATRSVAV